MGTKSILLYLNQVTCVLESFHADRNSMPINLLHTLRPPCPKPLSRFTHYVNCWRKGTLQSGHASRGYALSKSLSTLGIMFNWSDAFCGMLTYCIILPCGYLLVVTGARLEILTKFVIFLLVGF